MLGTDEPHWHDPLDTFFKRNILFMHAAYEQNWEDYTLYNVRMNVCTHYIYRITRVTR